MLIDTQIFYLDSSFTIFFKNSLLLNYNSEFTYYLFCYTPFYFCCIILISKDFLFTPSLMIIVSHFLSLILNFTPCFVRFANSLCLYRLYSFWFSLFNFPLLLFTQTCLYNYIMLVILLHLIIFLSKFSSCVILHSELSVVFISSTFHISFSFNFSFSIFSISTFRFPHNFICRFVIRFLFSMCTSF